MDAKGIKERAGGDPRILEELLNGLLKDPSERAVSLLKELLGLYQGEKRCLRVIKRAIFKLKQKGIEVEEPPPPPSVLRPVKLPEPKGYLGLWDPSGRLSLAIERQTPRGLLGCFGFGSPEEGLLDFLCTETTKKAWKEFIGKQGKSRLLPPVEIPPGYCLELLREMGRKKAPPAFEAGLRELGNLQYGGPFPLIYEHIPPGEVRDRPSLLGRIGEIFEIVPFFGFWTLEEEKLRPHYEELRGASESPLALTEAQKAQRLDGIILRALEDLFPEEVRRSLKRALEELALILFKNQGKDTAEVALAAALDVERPPSALGSNALLREIFLRALEIFKEPQQQSLILKP